MAEKEIKPPTVKERLAIVEALIARGERELLKEKDPLSLVDSTPADTLVQETEEGDIRESLKRVEVRRLFFRIFKLGGLMDADSDPNPTVMAHHVGRRSLALDIYAALKKVDAGCYWQMERENASDLKSKEKNHAD